MIDAAGVGILILAGGEATRLPGKLSLPVGDVSLLARVHQNLTSDGVKREVVVACKAAEAPALATLANTTIVVDRWPRHGPLGGILSAFQAMHSSHVFVAAGDAPFVDLACVRMLAAAWRAGDEAVVPRHQHDGVPTFEPLAALYDRVAFLRAGIPQLRSGDFAVHRVVDRLRSRVIACDDHRIFTNVNTRSDYDALLSRNTATSVPNSVSEIGVA